MFDNTAGLKLGEDKQHEEWRRIEEEVLPIAWPIGKDVLLNDIAGLHHGKAQRREERRRRGCST